MGKKAPAEQETGLSVVYKKTADLIPYARNARTHSEAQVNQIAASIKEFGFNNPILLDGANGVIAGHGRLMAAQKLGMLEVPTIELAHLSETQKKAYILADNKLALNAGWDLDMLGLELKELAATDLDMAVLGFSEKELGELTQPDATDGNTDPDDIPTLLANTVSAVGDLWLLQDHRLLCGDSTDLAQLQRLMGEQKADMIFTDPPYGVDFERGKFQGNNNAPKFAPIANDELKGDGLKAFCRQVFENARMVIKDSPVYMWSASLLEGARLAEGLQEAGFKIQSKIIWRKTPFVLGRSDYHWSHEECWYGFPAKAKGHPWYGGRDKSSVWEVPKPARMENHPTEKPVKLSEIAIENSSKGGDIVLDLFGGSGCTLIGAERLGRRAYLMELSPTYVDVMVRRWQKFSGKLAVLEATGQTFDQVAQERGADKGTMEVTLK